MVEHWAVCHVHYLQTDCLHTHCHHRARYPQLKGRMSCHFHGNWAAGRRIGGTADWGLRFERLELREIVDETGAVQRLVVVAAVVFEAVVAVAAVAVAAVEVAVAAGGMQCVA